MTGDKVAVVTGVITATDIGIKGRRVGMSVHDLGNRDRLGCSRLNQEAEDHLHPCMSSAPFEKVEAGTGDFTVLPWHPE
ncbi:hypothetical protein [Streptomyces sp. NPDC057580]|uniref:hypothetical protein n=2 Tax=Streptomyces TaxID=1883 RepID=UPI0036766571